MTLQLLGISLAAAVAQFIVGAIWYTPLFGSLWGKIHGFEKLDKKTQQKMMSQMGPIFGMQFAVTVVTSVLIAVLHKTFPDYSLYTLVGMIWLGFIVPAQVSGVLFGGTESRWMFAKIAVQAGGSLACLLVGAAVVQFLL